MRKPLVARRWAKSSLSLACMNDAEVCRRIRPGTESCQISLSAWMRFKAPLNRTASPQRQHFNDDCANGTLSGRRSFSINFFLGTAARLFHSGRSMSSVRKQYPFDLIEPKWQRIWDAAEVFRAWNPGEAVPPQHPFAKRHS